jgi:hypothetical protein
MGFHEKFDGRLSDEADIAYMLKGKPEPLGLLTEFTDFGLRDAENIDDSETVLGLEGVEANLTDGRGGNLSPSRREGNRSRSQKHFGIAGLLVRKGGIVVGSGNLDPRYRQRGRGRDLVDRRGPTSSRDRGRQDR